MSKSRIALFVAILAATTMCTSANAGMMVELGATDYLVVPDSTLVVSIDITSSADLTSVNPAISLDRTVGFGELTAVIVEDTVVAGDFWGDQATTVSDVLADDKEAGKFNVSLDGIGASATGGPSSVLTFDVSIPATAQIDDAWSINFITGATGSTYSVLDGDVSTAFSNLTPGTIRVIPEPGSVCLLLVGICVLIRRRRG